MLPNADLTGRAPSWTITVRRTKGARRRMRMFIHRSERSRCGKGCFGTANFNGKQCFVKVPDQHNARWAAKRRQSRIESRLPHCHVFVYSCRVLNHDARGMGSKVWPCKIYQRRWSVADTPTAALDHRGYCGELAVLRHRMKLKPTTASILRHLSPHYSGDLVLLLLPGRGER